MAGEVLIRRTINGLWGFADFDSLECGDIEAVVLTDLNNFPGVSVPINNTMQLLQALANLQAQVLSGSASVAVGLSATGTNQSGALKTTKLENFFTTVASGSGAYALPAIPCTRQIFHNNGTNALLLYPVYTTPAGGDLFIGSAANAPISIPVGGVLTIVCGTIGIWQFY